MINRYSTRREKVKDSFFKHKLKYAKNYDRIAGYFSSSIIEIAGEELSNIEGKVRVVCNSNIDNRDVESAKLAQAALKNEWCNFEPEKLSDASERFATLYDLLSSGKMEVKVLPNDRFGLIHGKAGVVTLRDNSKTSFMGSANETFSGWRLNYELVWEDDSDEAVKWVQEEFDTLWNDPKAVRLSEFIIQDVKRVSNRVLIETVEDWKDTPEPASTVVESPVVRGEFGLWEHQKYFVNKTYNDHLNAGARYVLADQVGLGKTIQLALSAQLMALKGDKPVLVIVPKTLLLQWQDELNNLLNVPSAIWNGKEWVDENGLKYPNKGPEDIDKCPRTIGIISQGLITSKSEVVHHLLNREYECVVVDEAHRARRKNLGNNKMGETPEPNNLYDYLLKLAKKTKSMLLATATPVQLYPIELWDLLNILSQNNEAVLGNIYSKWRRKDSIQQGLNIISGYNTPPDHESDYWEWIRNPFPPSNEAKQTFGTIRKRLNLSDMDFVIKNGYLDFPKPIQKKIEQIINNNFFEKFNPYIRHVVRRERGYLENKINPETNEPYLPRINVRLHGESSDEALNLTGYMKQAYELAEDFCNLLGKRHKSSGFLKTLLLKRIGSSIQAGLNTGRKMLNEWNTSFSDEYEEDEIIEMNDIKNLTHEEEELLKAFVNVLETNENTDPKFNAVVKLLKEWNWLERGCIIFSQYFDTAQWVASKLSYEFPNENIGLYAGGYKSGIIIDGEFKRKDKDVLKSMVKSRELKLLIGTDSASEGLNLQMLGTLINLDLPWNPTRLEQRKGRIQRIGQVNDSVHIYNLRYKDSIEDRVHSLLSERLQNVHGLFGQVPDVLEDVWVEVAMNEREKAERLIDQVPTKHPFEVRYNEEVEQIDWETCESVLDHKELRRYFERAW